MALATPDWRLRRTVIFTQRLRYIDKNKELLSELKQLEQFESSRILVCDDSKTSIGTADFCVVHYEVSPVSFVEYIEPFDMDELKKYISNYKCNYIFVANNHNSQDEDNWRNFYGKTFKYGTLLSLK